MGSTRHKIASERALGVEVVVDRQLLHVKARVDEIREELRVMRSELNAIRRINDNLIEGFKEMYEQGSIVMVPASVEEYVHESGTGAEGETLQEAYEKGDPIEFGEYTHEVFAQAFTQALEAMTMTVEHSQFPSPFTPASIKQFPCVCVSCGRSDYAVTAISEYPSRYIPPGWAAGDDGGVRCGLCVENRRFAPTFHENNTVYVRAADSHRPITRPADLYEIIVESRGRPKKTEVPMPDETSNSVTLSVNNLDTNIADEEEPMTRKDRLKEQAKRAGFALGDGVQLAVANEAGEVLVDIAKELSSDVPALQLALEHPDGREVAKLLVALLVQTAAEQTSIVPKSEYVAHACELQMTAAAFTLVGPRLNQLRKHFTKLAKIGEQLEGAYTEEEMEEANREVDNELLAMKRRIAELEANASRSAVDLRAPAAAEDAEEEEEVAAPHTRRKQA